MGLARRHRMRTIGADGFRTRPRPAPAILLLAATICGCAGPATQRRNAGLTNADLIRSDLPKADFTSRHNPARPETRPRRTTFIALVWDLPIELPDKPMSCFCRVYGSGFECTEAVMVEIGVREFAMRLRTSLPEDEPICMYFEVPSKPPFHTRFRRGEWVYRGRPRTTLAGADVQVLSIGLSELTWRLPEQVATSMAPG